MNYLELARAGLRMPIGADLVLQEHADAAAIVLDGDRLGRVVEETARRFGTPLAIPLMDLRLEKADLLQAFGVAASDVDTYHLSSVPENLADVVRGGSPPFPARNRAHLDSVRYVAENTDLWPVGMAIGPFSLLTKLMADPITALALAGLGVPDESVELARACLDAAEWAVGRSLDAQMDAGARAILVCEPAANIVYISPKQIRAGSGVWEHFVMGPALRMKARLDARGVDLIFHDCGELSDFMVEQFGHRIRPAILSLGSSRKLWEDAARIPADVVLFGNLPTKNFYSDAVMPDERVEALTLELIAKMQATGHPHILGSECDVLHVPAAAQSIRRKVDLMLHCSPR